MLSQRFKKDISAHNTKQNPHYNHMLNSSCCSSWVLMSDFANSSMQC